MFRTTSIITVRGRDLAATEEHLRATQRGPLVIKVNGTWREVFEVIDQAYADDFARQYAGSPAPYDHGNTVQRAFENNPEGTVVCARILLDEKSDCSNVEDEIVILREVDLIEVQWPSEGEETPTMRSVHKDTAMAITFAGEAWEFMYRLLKDFTDQHYCVTISGRDMALQRVEGDVFETEAVLIVKPWAEEKQDYVGAEERIRLFHDDGQCAITQFHVI